VNITSALNAGALGIQIGLADACRNPALIAGAYGDVAKPFAGLMQSQRQVETSARVVRTVTEMLATLDMKA